MLTCTFFGHRDTGEETEPKLKATLIDLIENHHVRNFYVGNNGRYDCMVKRLLVELKEIYSIRYAVVLAYLPVKKHNTEDENPPDTILPDGIESVPRKFAISYRNKWMIEQSDYVVTYVRYNVGGAARFKEYAVRKNKIIINLAEK